MEIFQIALDVFFNLDGYILALVEQYGDWIYIISFLIVFFETGVVLTPFLPGDSLLFVLGAIGAGGLLNIHFTVGILMLAAFLGDTLNYAIGSYLGPKVFSKKDSKIFNPNHLLRTRRFLDLHGGKAVVLARFIPIIRTYAPFVAGVGSMQYRSFVFFNILGAVLWVVTLSYAGFFFGNIPVVKDNISLVIILIILLSISPVLVGLIKSFWLKR